MMRATALSLHELSYLCGGPRRAVLTAVLALCQSEQLELGADGRAYRVDETPSTAGWPVEADVVELAVLEVVTVGGIDLKAIVETVAGSRAIRQTRGMLAARGLAPKWWPGLTGAGRRARREVLANPPEGLRRIAVLGPKAIEDAQLRRTLSEPSYRTERQGVHPTPVRRGAASNA
ncbi:TIGR04222 domain-containing membrane protein [Kribbella sp. NPDC051718]|uniref:TIGR04222 domain-containing membrane protein n=1 Tax=Kribbella sp. NPDC051718 TaxID=3155168 RepID=UPI00341DEC25